MWKSTDRYVREDDLLQKVPERRADAKLFYYHCDQIGTPQLLTDGDGDVVWEASYKAWGEAREVIARASKAAGIVPRNPLRFQGQQVDAETGLHYNRYRYYDSRIARFISTDPIRILGGLNSYRYVPNSTVWVDPLGLTAKKALCYALLAKIETKTTLLRLEMDKYSPKDDALGGHTHAHGITVPGGHYKEIRDLQRGIKNSLKAYTDKDCHCECNLIKARPILDSADRYSNKEVEIPPGVVYIPIASNR